MSESWLVALLSPPYATLTYRAPAAPSGWASGMRVLVPLGASAAPRVGVLLRPESLSEAAGRDAVELKEILWPMERSPLLDADYLELVDQLAKRLMLSPGRILGNHLPQGLRSASSAFLVFDGPKPRRLSPRAFSALAAPERARLAELWRLNRMELKDPALTGAAQEFCCVVKDPPWPVRPAAKRQMELLEHLWDCGPTPRSSLARTLGPWTGQALARLVAAGVVRIEPRPEEFEATDAACLPDLEERGRSFALTIEQLAAVEKLAGAMDSAKPGAALLYGVTGSGKTAVYLELAQRSLESGRSVMLLAPEVALAASLYRAARQWFPERSVFLYHGYQTPARRQQTFLDLARRTEPCVVTGTRSALFLPVLRPGLVVLDEEHDASFKQEERLAYQAKEIAFFVTEQSSGLLVLGSATPDVKTFHAAQEGLLPLVSLRHRVGRSVLPAVRLVDIRQLKPTEHQLADESLEHLREAVRAGDQAIILLNRRGYAPLMYCLDCGRTAKCPHCEIGLTYHRARERLVCHYCGYALPFPMVCADCGCSSWLPMGEGTEKIEEALSALLPSGTGVLRLDRDSTRRQGRLEEILAEFASGRAQVLVGTQMLSKGHHFPGVTLVVVADGDLGLNLPDYRATERTFQLLVQVAGRAGRGDKPGEVLIQTRDPGHYCWGFIVENDYRGFFEREQSVREKRRYPPFTKLGLIRMTFPVGCEDGMQRITELARLVRDAGRACGVTVLGPAPAPLGMLRGRKRFQCLLKADEWLAIRSLYGRIRQSLPISFPVRLELDLDPVNML